jgi:hypothetical protein
MKKIMKKAQDGYTTSEKKEIRRAPKKPVTLRAKLSGTAYTPFSRDEVRQEIDQRKINKKNADADSVKANKRNFEDINSITLEDMKLRKMGGKVSKKMQMGGSLKTPAADQKGLKKLPTPVRNKMGFKKNGGVMSKKK